MEELQLNGPEHEIRSGRKGESELESDVTTIWRLTSVKGDWTNEPSLTHSSDHTSNTAAESEHSSDSRR